MNGPVGRPTPVSALPAARAGSPMTCASTQATAAPAKTGSEPSQAVAVLIVPGLVAAAARAENFRNRHGRHRHAIGSPLGFQPVARSLLDHEIDEFEPLGIVGRFEPAVFDSDRSRSSLPACSWHAPHTRFPQTDTVDQPLHARNGFAGPIPLPRILACRVLQN